MQLFITGATGFIGSWLVRYFAAGGRPPMASGRGDPPSSLLDLAGYLRADICRPMATVGADVVIHAAALASDSATAPALKAANIHGTRHVFEATRDCKIFLYISSSSVYDNRNTAHVEDEPVDYRHLSPYGLSKRLAEDWLLQQDWRRRTLVILRPRAVYGPGDRVLLPRLLRLRRRGRIVIPGDLRVQSALTYVGNLCQAVAACLVYFEKHPGGAHCFNVSDAEPYEMRDVVGNLLSAVYGDQMPFREIPVLPLSVAARVLEWLRIPAPFTRFGLAAATQNSVMNIEKINQIIGFQPEKNLWEVLPDIGAWANAVGLPAVQAGAADLPWNKVTGTLFIPPDACPLPLKGS